MTSQELERAAAILSECFKDVDDQLLYQIRNYPLERPKLLAQLDALELVRISLNVRIDRIGTD